MSIARTDRPSLSQQDIRISAFTDSHLGSALRLSREAGWPHRAEDWALSLAFSQGVVALDGDEVVGTALCSSFGEVSTLNMILVDGRMRRRGLGRTLTERLITMGGTRELRLVATEDGLPLYETLGFVANGRIEQLQGIAQPATPELAVTMGQAKDADALARMDHAASRMSRAGLIAEIATKGEVLSARGGFAVLRDFGRGKVLGPVVAQDPGTARSLMAEAASRCESRFLRMDMPATAGLGAYAQTLGLAHVGGGIAMHRAPRDTVPSEFKTYALVSQALG